MSHPTTHLIILPLRSQNEAEIFALRHVLTLLSVQPAERGGPVQRYVRHPLSCIRHTVSLILLIFTLYIT